jgi:hypothetical protein
VTSSRSPSTVHPSPSRKSLTLMQILGIVGAAGLIGYVLLNLFV